MQPLIKGLIKDPGEIVMPIGRWIGRKASGERISIRLGHDSIVHCSFRAGSPNIVTAGTLDSGTIQSLDQLISGQSFDAPPSSCQLVVGPSYYHIVQVDRPRVEEAEMAQALSWAIKDLVPIPPEQMILDYFELPVQPSGADKINVVCSDLQKLKPLVDALHKAKLPLQGIGVDELNLPKLFPLVDEAQLLLIQQAGEELLLLIVKQGQLYFSRRIRGYDQLATMGQEELLAGVMDNLSLEVQRSLDYFESQLRQAPVKQILVALPLADELCLPPLSANFFIPVHRFEPEAALSATLNSGELLALAGIIAAGAEEV
jgi:MSHA biogenesis protein MshI